MRRGGQRCCANGMAGFGEECDAAVGVGDSLVGAEQSQRRREWVLLKRRAWSRVASVNRNGSLAGAVGERPRRPGLRSVLDRYAGRTRSRSTRTRGYKEASVDAVYPERDAVDGASPAQPETRPMCLTLSLHRISQSDTE